MFLSVTDTRGLFTEMEGDLKKKFWAILLAVILALGIFPSAGVEAQAASTHVCHILVSSTPVYKNTGLSKKQATIKQSQEITILSYNNNYGRIRYKSGKKNKYGYIRRSSFLTTTRGTTVRSKAAMTTYYKTSTRSRYGSFTKNTSVIVYGKTGSYTQVGYGINRGGRKFALVPTSQANKYLNGSSSKTNQTTSKKTGSTASTASSAKAAGTVTSAAATSTAATAQKAASASVSQTSTNSGTSSKRQTVVSYMRAMATIKWKPSKTITYWSSGSRRWVRGTVYSGIPYTQHSRTTTLEQFRNYLSGSTYTGPSGRTTYKGTDCSSSVSIAWRKVNSSIGIRWTGSMTPGNRGIAKVGNYVTNSSNTKRSCSSTGRNKMYAAYRKLQPGDAIVTHGSSYHTRLVVSVSSNGVTCIEQSGLVSSNRTSWKVNQYYSFASLYNSGYVPVTMSSW